MLVDEEWGKEGSKGSWRARVYVVPSILASVAEQFPFFDFHPQTRAA